MVDYREILRLHHEGYSQRQIERSVGSSRHTITQVLSTAEALGVAWPLEDRLTNEMLQATFFPEKYHSASLHAEPDYAKLHKELGKPGVTLTLFWAEYSDSTRTMGKTPYMYTQFCEKYRK